MIPGFANCHSHAFHRALRGRSQALPATGRGSFWTWREQMYAVAARLTPESLHDLAVATYTEMLCAGITSVGEFHYLHHQPDGTPYADPNEMGHALVAAAREVGIRIALLDTCYLAAGLEPDGGHRPVEGVQVRFSDGDVDAWAERFTALAAAYDGSDDVRIGAGIHSVRAVPAAAMGTIVTAASGRPLHVHLSEQPAENEQCLAAYGCTPARLLTDHGVLGPWTTAVHATHLTADDIGLLGAAGTHACFCPTTERDLADGIGPSRALHTAGSRLTLGSDSHAVIDPFEEMRAVELDERLSTGIRGHWSASELIEAATTTGHGSLGFDAADTAADVVTVDLGSPRTAGTGPGEEALVFAAAAADVLTVRIGAEIHDIRALREDLRGQWQRLEGVLAP
ncbi:formimidoylglutamate deiminase [Nocardioides sp. AE5]|uniref:formimidoylglutamate deiminase n=1 Tax=Nocardioides sp. AE5 TaxID=2962573 RepID=UPI002882C223|nr:formimidoylglutamate deiminase [Nocardioides sp. AE5]MDT0203500.1 formimidoylglutamate deiminase [Nocardioides sp. AE5]